VLPKKTNHLKQDLDTPDWSQSSLTTGQSLCGVSLWILKLNDELKGEDIHLESSILTSPASSRRKRKNTNSNLRGWVPFSQTFLIDQRLEALISNEI